MKVIEFINEYNPDVWEKKDAKFIIRHGNYDLGAYFIDYAKNGANLVPTIKYNNLVGELLTEKITSRHMTEDEKYNTWVLYIEGENNLFKEHGE